MHTSSTAYKAVLSLKMFVAVPLPHWGRLLRSEFSSIL